MASSLFDLMIVFVFIIGGFLAMITIITYMRSNRLVVRSATNKGSVIEGYYWMIPKKNKHDGSIWWHSAFFQKRLKIPEPPSKVIDLTRKGKKWVEVNRLSEDEYVYLRDNGLNADIVLEEGGKKISEAFKPFSVVQRATIITQYTKAEAEKPRDKIQMLINNIPVVVLGLVVVIALIYGADLMSSYNDVAGSANTLLDKAITAVQSAGGEVTSLTEQTSGGHYSTSESPP